MDDDMSEDDSMDDENKFAKDTKLNKESKSSKVPKVGKSAKICKREKRSKAPAVMTRRKAKKRTQSFALHIYKVLKQIHPDVGISKRGMNIMNSFMNDIFDRMATEATKLLRSTQKRTLTSREIETAARLMLPGELSKHAVSEGTKAVTKYN